MTPLVLLPGMMCDARLWAPVMGAFGRRTVIHGAITEHDTIEALAAQVLADAPPRFALAGKQMLVERVLLLLATTGAPCCAVGWSHCLPLAQVGPSRLLLASPRCRRGLWLAHFGCRGCKAVLRECCRPRFNLAALQAA